MSMWNDKIKVLIASPPIRDPALVEQEHIAAIFSGLPIADVELACLPPPPLPRARASPLRHHRGKMPKSAPAASVKDKGQPSKWTSRESTVKSAPAATTAGKGNSKDQPSVLTSRETTAQTTAQTVATTKSKAKGRPSLLTLRDGRPTSAFAGAAAAKGKGKGQPFMWISREITAMYAPASTAKGKGKDQATASTKRETTAKYAPTAAAAAKGKAKSQLSTSTSREATTNAAPPAAAKGKGKGQPSTLTWRATTIKSAPAATEKSKGKGRPSASTSRESTSIAKGKDTSVVSSDGWGPIRDLIATEKGDTVQLREGLQVVSDMVDLREIAADINAVLNVSSLGALMRKEAGWPRLKGQTQPDLCSIFSWQRFDNTTVKQFVSTYRENVPTSLCAELAHFCEPILLWGWPDEPTSLNYRRKGTDHLDYTDDRFLMMDPLARRDMCDYAEVIAVFCFYLEWYKGIKLLRGLSWAQTSPPRTMRCGACLWGDLAGVEQGEGLVGLLVGAEKWAGASNEEIAE
ncbi:hypothetical protein BDK51DRAFT_27696 [Blyttiomyces helicus]|uniref:Uncharacterized protein n=1 Tax=Blyttiomyces helicus TaxID=388810 RepID=A0A4P9WIJ9_9FUNG|nr:hypothetical protein BDK51DRAFT_27696 [Blyttiomyces helicus]|eukprot:RKO91835.1 hypothetical protein BDK51DRAFT_27696 [Blyttiomyces helicus]